MAPELLADRREQLVADAVVDGQLAVHLPVVLRVHPPSFFLRRDEVGRRQLAGRNPSKKERSIAVPGQVTERVSAVGERGLLAIKAPIAVRTRELEEGEFDWAEFGAELERMLVLLDRHVLNKVPNVVVLL